jgi:hypothetical protein
MNTSITLGFKHKILLRTEGFEMDKLYCVRNQTAQWGQRHVKKHLSIQSKENGIQKLNLRFLLPKGQIHELIIYIEHWTNEHTSVRL